MDTMTPEALAESLHIILDFRVDIENPIKYTLIIKDERVIRNINFATLFADTAQYSNASDLLLRLITQVDVFRPLASFINKWALNNLDEDMLKQRFISFEEYIKDIIGIIDGEDTRRELDRTFGLSQILTIAKENYKVIGEDPTNAFKTLLDIRNTIGHGNTFAKIISNMGDKIPTLFFVCLLHIISRCPEQLNAYLADKVRESESAPADEEEMIKKYVERCAEAYASYLDNNVLHAKGIEASLMPVQIRETKSTEKQDYDALEFLKNAPNGIYVILGVPGAGKSTLLNSYLSGVCRAFISGESDAVPLLIRASEVSRDMSFIDTLYATAKENLMDSRTAEKLLNEGRFAIAIDGINEFHPEVNVKNFLRATLQTAKGRLVLTGRIYEYASVRNTIAEYGKHRTLEIQDISSATISEFVKTLKLDEVKSHRMLEMFANDRILSLLNSPLNLSFLIRIVKGGGDNFNFSNRGGLISEFISMVLAREELTDERIGWLLENLALHTAAAGFVSIFDFVHKAKQDFPTLYESENKEEVREKLIEPLVRAGILEKVDDAGIKFRFDTLREFFLARLYNDSLIAASEGTQLSGRELTELPAVDDDNNNETFRLMLELLDDKNARDLAERLFSDQTGKRITLPLSPEMYISRPNKPLVWICNLVKTLNSGTRIDTKKVCGNWVVNNMKILLEQKKNALPEVYGTVTRAAASLCTDRVIRFITGDNWIGKMIELGREKDFASELAANASDARLVHKLLTEKMPEYRKKDKEIGEVLRDIHRKLLSGMKTLQLELLHRDIGRRINGIESKKQSVPTEIYADYYLTALLTKDMELIGAVPSHVIKKAEPSMQHSDYDRLLGSCATTDTESALFDFFAKRTDKYRTDINLLVYVIEYLVSHNNENFAAALLNCDSVVRIIEERYDSESTLRKICALLPIQLIPYKIATRLYETSLLKIALKNAEENNFARNLKHNAEEAFATVVNDNLYFNTAGANARPNSLKTDVKLLSIDGRDSLTVVCGTLAETETYTGAKATIGIGNAQTIEGTVEKCEPFGGEYFEMIFGFRGTPVRNLQGKIDWENSELRRKDWLEYSMCAYEGNTVMLRFTGNGALSQLNKKEVREALASPLTVFRIAGKLYIPLRSVRYPKVQNGTRIKIRLDKPLRTDDRNYVNITTIMLTNAEGKGMPVFLQNYVEGRNKNVRPLLLFREKGAADAEMLFDEKTVRRVCSGLWVSAQDSDFHALVKDGTENFEKILECTSFEPGCREIPARGTFIIHKTDIAVRYILSESDGKGKFRLFLLTDGTTAVQFIDIADNLPKLIFGDGSNGILQRKPEITDHGAGISVKISMHAAPDDIMEKWSDTPSVDFNVLRPVINECKIRDIVYTATAIPYIRRKDGIMEIPVPANAGEVSGLQVYVNDRSRKSLPCTVHPLSGINNFAKTMEVGLKNPAGLAPAIDKDRGLLFIKTGSWLEYRNILSVVQFDSGKLYHPDMVRPVIEAMIQNDDTGLDGTRMKFFHDSNSEYLLNLYDVTRAQLSKYKADENNG